MKSNFLDEWTHIYNQNKPLNEFKDCKLGSCSIEIDEENFMRFDLLKPSDDHVFKLGWKNGEQVQWIQWTQKQNPLAAQDRVQDF